MYHVKLRVKRIGLVTALSKALIKFKLVYLMFFLFGSENTMILLERLFNKILCAEVIE